METQLQLVDHHDTTPVETPETGIAAETPSAAASCPSQDGSRPNRSSPDWHIDDASKAGGRAGIALARAALAEARLRRPIMSDQQVDHTTAA